MALLTSVFLETESVRGERVQAVTWAAGKYPALPQPCWDFHRITEGGRGLQVGPPQKVSQGCGLEALGVNLLSLAGCVILAKFLSLSEPVSPTVTWG